MVLSSISAIAIPLQQALQTSSQEAGTVTATVTPLVRRAQRRLRFTYASFPFGAWSLVSVAPSGTSASVCYRLADLFRVEMLFRPLVSAVLAPVGVAKIVDLDDQGHFRFEHHWAGCSGSVFLGIRLYLLAVYEFLLDQSNLEPSTARGAVSEECPNFLCQS